MNYGTIYSCHSSGLVSSGGNSSNTGGLCGANNRGAIDRCYSNCEVSGFRRLGGLCGYNSMWGGGTIKNSYASGCVTGEMSVGGFCGYFYSGSISDCYATGDVVGVGSPSYLGGFCGTINYTNISNCYCVGEVSVDGRPINVGGFCGDSSGDISNCFWDVETAGEDCLDVNNFGAWGLSTAEMQMESTFSEAGWAFGDYLNDRQGWYMPGANSYPLLCWQNDDLVQVPDVIGMTVTQAQASLISAGFAVGDVYYVKSWQSPVDSVAGISASVGSYIDKTSANLDIYISTGSSGDGSEGNPYQIASQADVDAVNNDPCASYVMTCDVYMNFNEFYSEAVISGFPVFEGTFDGNDHSINNLNINISGYANYIGFFGRINGTEALIKDLKIENCRITYDSSNTRKFIGVLGGEIVDCRIINCSTDGKITGPGYVEYLGGFCGRNSNTTIMNCHSTTNLTIEGNSNYYIGGFTGESNYESIIVNCYSTGNIKILNSISNQNYYVGGLAGESSGILNNCYFSGDINTVGGCYYMGGISGINKGCLNNCYSSGNIYSGDDSHYMGGLTGDNSGGIVNCYSISKVTGDRYIGGLTGKNDMSFIINCYSAGEVNGNYRVGGLIGECYKSGISNCFLDVNSSGTDLLYTKRHWDNGSLIYSPIYNTPTVAEGKTTVQMQTKNTFTDAGWKFTDYNDTNIDNWCMDVNSYPLLGWQDDAVELVTVPYIEDLNLAQVQNQLQAAGFTIGEIIEVNSLTITQGDVAGISVAQCGVYINPVEVDIYLSIGSIADGSANNPYEIASQKDLEEINNDLSANYIMNRDIYLFGGYENGVITRDYYSFRGSFNGCGHSINNLIITNCGYSQNGLFNQVNSNAEIKNLELKNALVVTGGDTTGSLVGSNYGSIINCNVNGTIITNGTACCYVGGLAGMNHSLISNCHCKDMLVCSTDEYVGAMVGYSEYNSYNDNTIMNCSVTGTVFGNNFVGGLTGESFSKKISNCYSDVTVKGVSNIGGLIGKNCGGSVTDCYSVGQITGTENVGGLAGYNDCYISNCYSTGKVSGEDYTGSLIGLCSDSSIINCFWDVNTATTTNGYNLDSSNPSAITNVVGKTTAEMQTLSTFVDGGWDFVGEDVNGGEDVWRMCIDGVDYPRLWWEFGIGDFVCGDGVDMVDFAVLAESWGLASEQYGYNDRCDLVDDDLIDFADMEVFAEYWLEGVE